MSLALTLAVRGVTLLGVLLVVLVLVVVVLGATGFSDRMLTAIVNEELRGVRESLAKTIRDPDRLEETVRARRQELERFYGLNRPWYTRLPDVVRRVITLDLGEARNLRSFKGSPKVTSLVLERLPYTILLLTTAPSSRQSSAWCWGSSWPLGWVLPWTGASHTYRPSPMPYLPGGRVYC